MNEPIRVDPGEPPATFKRQNEELRRPRSTEARTEASSPTSATVHPVVMQSPPVVKMPELGDVFPPTHVSRPVERVELEYVSADPNLPGFVLAFNVAEVCVREHYISLMLVTDMGFRPSGMTKFTLKHGGKSYPVIFVGAEFEFQTVNVRGISFLVDKHQINDQTR